MKRRSIAALLLVTVVAAAVAATTSGATKKANASSITVWLQTDAQSGWADLVASVNQKFQSDHPGTTVNIQYQNWGDHLQKFDATLAGGGGPDVIEMGNTEMTKYMAAGAFADLSSAKSAFDNSAIVADRSRQVGPLRRKDLRRSVLRRLAGRDLPLRPLQEGGHLKAAELDRRVRRRRAEAAGEEREEGVLARSTSPAPTGTSRWASCSTTAEASRRR